MKEQATDEATNDEEVMKKVAEKLEFFFSDVNLRSDRFMRWELEKHSKIAISKLLKFNTIKKLTTDEELIAKAAESDLNKDTLKLSEDRKYIGRLVAFDAEKSQDNKPLTLHVANLPVEPVSQDAGKDCQKKYLVGIDDVKNLFNPYGKVTLVRLRRSKPAKKGGPTSALGEAFVEYETAEMASTAAGDLCAPIKDDAKPEDGNLEDQSPDVKNEPNVKLSLKGNELTVTKMVNWMKKRKAEKAEEGSGDDGQMKQEKEEEKFEVVWEKNCVISVKGFPDNCDREAIREAIKEYSEVENDLYVDYARGQKDGAIRFNKFNEKIAELAEKLDSGSIKVGDCAVESAVVLKDKEEDEYWAKFIVFKTKQMRQRAEERQGPRRKKRRNK